MRTALLLVVMSLAISAWGKGISVKAVIGSWEGESKCVVADSPCHDENVLIQIAQDKRDPWTLKMDAYKMVDAVPDFMGTLTCQFHSGAGTLSCTGDTSSKDDWEFQISGDTMMGRLTIDDGKTLYRRLMLHKASTPGK